MFCYWHDYESIRLTTVAIDDIINITDKHVYVEIEYKKRFDLTAIISKNPKKMYVSEDQSEKVKENYEALSKLLTDCHVYHPLYSPARKEFRFNM